MFSSSMNYFHLQTEQVCSQIQTMLKHLLINYNYISLAWLSILLLPSKLSSIIISEKYEIITNNTLLIIQEVTLSISYVKGITDVTIGDFSGKRHINIH